MFIAGTHSRGVPSTVTTPSPPRAAVTSQRGFFPPAREGENGFAENVRSREEKYFRKAVKTSYSIPVVAPGREVSTDLDCLFSF